MLIKTHECMCLKVYFNYACLCVIKKIIKGNVKDSHFPFHDKDNFAFASSVRGVVAQKWIVWKKEK